MGYSSRSGVKAGLCVTPGASSSILCFTVLVSSRGVVCVVWAVENTLPTPRLERASTHTLVEYSRTGRALGFGARAANRCCESGCFPTCMLIFERMLTQQSLQDTAIIIWLIVQPLLLFESVRTKGRLGSNSINYRSAVRPSKCKNSRCSP